jgi:O-acetylserine/cysteine efflux transporter
VPAWIGLGYTILLGTLLGSGVWVWLMARHPASTVAPFSMLVPVVGIATAAIALGERPAPLELAGGVLVIAGVLWSSRPSRASSTRALRTPPAGDTPQTPATRTPATRTLGPARRASMGS